MKGRIWLAVFVVLSAGAGMGELFLACTAHASEPDSPGAAPRPASTQPVVPVLADCAWLSGTWRGGLGAGRFEEVWTELDGGSMLGTGRLIHGEATTMFEFMRLHQAEGGLVYEAWPQGRGPTAFAAVVSAEGSLVFENVRADFPSRIAYRRLDADRFEVTLSGQADAGGRLREMRWTMQRVVAGQD